MRVTVDVGSAIDVAALTVRRGGRVVLDSLSCRIAPASVTGLLGPSGSGKTTLMRSIVGVQRIAAGTVSVFGLPAGSPELRARTGYMTQSVSIYDDLTVAENVRYFATVAGAGRTAVARTIDEVGLAGAARQLVHTLSGGQRSRASLACALVGDPELLVLDEPTVGQDPVLREELWDMFHARARAGATVVVSSHVMDEAVRCDRLLLIRDGALLADDTPAGVQAAAGTDDMDAAFLTLIRQSGQEPLGGRERGIDGGADGRADAVTDLAAKAAEQRHTRSDASDTGGRHARGDRQGHGQ
ncbi:MAG: multidrug ABC transporter ATP-binding protein [Actinobacteria bacterium 69-20]|nr:MAG: multidrug ABC transporter ATP-binding protein [Actinobacteria bacterium 69-20]